MRDTPRPSCLATENLPLEFVDGGSGLPAITLGALDAIGALGVTSGTGAGTCRAGVTADAACVPNVSNSGPGCLAGLSAEAICEVGAEAEAVRGDGTGAGAPRSASITIRYGL